MKESEEPHQPLIVFVAALLGVGFGGFLGAFLAIPTAGCIKVLIEDHFQSKQQESKS
jgi:predicted PurR-regulated permease PerM